MLQRLKVLIKSILSAGKFRKLIRDYCENPMRSTDQRQQSLLRRNFVLNGRKELEWAVKYCKVASRNKPRNLSIVEFINVSAEERAEAVLQFNTLGYYVFNERIPDSIIDEIVTYLGSQSITSASDDTDVQSFETIKPKCPTYWHKQSDLLESEHLRHMITSPALNEIATSILGCTPVFDMVAAWWSFPSQNPDSASAQLFHFDLDRLKWVKVFVYLTDVTDDNGPHVFLEGSHKFNGKYPHDGRFSDEDVYALTDNMYPERRITGRKGTVFIEDTLGLHKGTPVKRGCRGVFEIEFSIGHFGYPYPQTPLD
jgi:hypothetical protein